MRRPRAQLAARFVALCALCCVGLPSLALAKPKKKPPPTGKEERSDKDDLEEDADRRLFVKSIVESTTKTRTTVAEAPAVVHVITAGDIAAFGHRNLLDTLLFVPGFLEANGQYDQVPGWMALGVIQSVLYLRDGISMFDPLHNVPATVRRIPLETIKRIEAMTNPGGVLWGANSFLGVVNVLTKNPEDVNGVELGLGGGHGPGDELVMRPYVLWGQTFLGGRLGVLAHWSLEWFQGPRYTMPELWVTSSPAELNGPSSYRYPMGIDSRVPTSFFSQLDGKIRYVKPGTPRQLTLGWQFTFHKMPNFVLTLKNERMEWWDGIHRPLGFWSVPQNSRSPNPVLRENNINWHDSYVYLHYGDRYSKNRLGLDAKAYYVKFERNMEPFIYIPYTNDLIPGVANRVKANGHRSGVTLDMNFDITKSFKVLWGGELFYEWVKDTRSQFIAPVDATGQLNYSILRVVGCPYYNRNGDNIPVYDPANPANSTYVPGCQQPFVLDSDRLVYAAYLSAQYKPHRTLSLNGGLRLQHGPAGNVSYEPTLLYSAAAVWNIWRELYLKVNYATGFRPPVFSSTSGNSSGGNYQGDPNLVSEKSQAVQAEFTARLFKNVKRIRQWVVRAGYSYTHLSRMIRMIGGMYFNTDDRALHSAQFHTDLHLRGGHRFMLSYTYLRQHGSSPMDGGVFRSVPNHWVAGGAVFNLLHRGRWKLDLNLTMRIIGPFEDPNQAMICPAGGEQCTSRVSDRIYDRIHPAAIFNAGARLRVLLGKKPLELTANFYNMLDGKNWTSDVFHDLGSTLDMLPTPAQRFYFFLAAKILL